MNQSPAAAPEEKTASEPVAILLVDDDANNLLALESILDCAEYELVQAQSSDAALLALMQGEYAAIVLDVQMPGLSGIELARMIKQRKRTQNIPILFLTAHYRENEHAVLAYDVGAVDYMTKPVHPAVLRSKVGVFVELFRKTRALAGMNATLGAEVVERKRAEEALRTANADLAATNAALKSEAAERVLRLKAEAARAEAEAANEAKDRFLAMLSHELRTPLSPVLHTISLLEDNPEVSPSLRENLEMIRRNVQLEARLIDDLLDLSRVRNGKLILHSTEIDGHDVLRRALDICEPAIDARRLEVRMKLDASATTLSADPARLQQVFWNLIANAVKFTPEGGLISISSSTTTANFLRVEIADTGAGIEDAKLGRIFNAFEQAKSDSAGLGLGLAICKALTEFHRGTIGVRSDGLGRGATFWVELPIVVPKASGPSAAVKGEETGKLSTPIRVLVVEDHLDTATTLCRLLARRGYVVEAAGTCQAAREKAADFGFDILVTDIGLPDGNGVELFTSLKRSDRHADLRGIALSGYGMDDDLARSHAAGFADHLTKPVDFATLDRCLRRIAQERVSSGATGA